MKASTATQLRPFTASLPMALLRARETTMRVFRPMLADHDLTEQQWRVLRALRAEVDPVDATRLAEATCLLAPSLSRILAHLRDEGLIERAADPTDQRRSLVSLSAAGRERVAQVAPTSEWGYAAIEDAFGAERLAHLLAELQDLADLEVELGDRQENDDDDH